MTHALRRNEALTGVSPLVHLRFHMFHISILPPILSEFSRPLKTIRFLIFWLFILQFELIMLFVLERVVCLTTISQCDFEDFCLNFSFLSFPDDRIPFLESAGSVTLMSLVFL